MASCERTVILEHNRQSLDFREEISTMGTGRFYDDRQSARRFGKTTKFVGNCGDVMRCPVNLDLNIQNYQRLTIFATSTHKDRLLHDSDFVFKISAIGVVFFQDTDSTHWFDPVELQELMDRKRNVSWIWKLWVTLLNVSMLTWSASFFSRKCINFVEAKLKQHLNFFCSKTLQTRHNLGLLKGILGWHFTPNPDGFPALLSGWFSFSFLRRPDFGAGVPGYLVCAPGMKLRWFGQTTWVVSLDWRKTTPKIWGYRRSLNEFWG